jgi:outer membrane receptor protein involved in Fe transport
MKTGLAGRVFFGAIAAAIPALTITLPHVAAAQQPAATGQVSGQVRDALDRPLAGAGVRLENVQGQVVARTQTDRDGRFVLRDVPPGVYSLVSERTGYETATSVVTVSEGGTATSNLTLAASQSLNLSLAEQRLNEARNGLSPDIGTSVYTIDRQAIQSQPSGDATPLEQVLLQAPGVNLDSKEGGSFHIRGEHANAQFRLNGILLPAGISGFQQNIDSRFIDSIRVITGALPAQYGLRTAGVIDIQTKSGTFDKGGSIGVYGGSHETLQHNISYGGSIGTFNYFATGTYAYTGQGIEKPTDAPEAVHDRETDLKGLGYFSYLFPNLTTRASLILGTANSYFEIPNIPNRTPSFSFDSGSTIDSINLNQRQIEHNQFAIAALQDSTGKADWQVAYFNRYSSLRYKPDPLGDLLYNGVAPDLLRTSFTNGLQGDGSYPLTETHTLRSGFYASTEHVTANSMTGVFPGDASTGQTSGTPFTIQDDNAITGNTYGVYLQDEWKVTPAWTINGGLRYDYVTGFRSESQASPRLNTVYEFPTATALHAGWGRFFTPTPLEIGGLRTLDRFSGTTAFNSANGSTNDAPFAERASVYDVGVTQKVTNEIQIGADGYYKYARHLLDEGQFGAPVILTPFNYEYGMIRGVEFTSTYTTPRLQAYFNLAASKAEGKDIISAQATQSADDLAFIQNNWIPLDHQQSYTISTGISYKATDTLRLLANGFYGEGLRYTNLTPNDRHLAPYHVVNLGAVQRIHNEGALGDIDLRIALLNVFDASYGIRNGTGVGAGAPQFGGRRSVFAGITKYF